MNRLFLLDAELAILRDMSYLFDELEKISYPHCRFYSDCDKPNKLIQLLNFLRIKGLFNSGKIHQEHRYQILLKNTLHKILDFKEEVKKAYLLSRFQSPFYN